MIDVNNPKIQKYVEEALQKQREEIAERILWRNAGAPYLGPSMEEIEYYTGLSLDQLATIEEKCKWKLQTRENVTTIVVRMLTDQVHTPRCEITLHAIRIAKLLLECLQR